MSDSPLASQEIIHSSAVGDDFSIVVHRPAVAGPLPLLIYLDAQLPTGRWVPQVAQSLAAEGRIPPLLTVGVGQVGSYFRKRNRDLIPSRRPGEQADAFYRFLVRELLPHLRRAHSLGEGCAIAGHSLGGLFALHAFLQPDNPFDRIVALSPSVWMNRRRILRSAKAKPIAEPGGPVHLYMACGGLERFNLILPGMRAFADWTAAQDVPGWVLRSEILPWKNHFSVVKPGMRRGLEWVFAAD